MDYVVCDWESDKKIEKIFIWFGHIEGVASIDILSVIGQKPDFTWLKSEELWKAANMGVFQEILV